MMMAVDMLCVLRNVSFVRPTVAYKWENDDDEMEWKMQMEWDRLDGFYVFLFFSSFLALPLAGTYDTEQVIINKRTLNDKATRSDIVNHHWLKPGAQRKKKVDILNLHKSSNQTLCVCVVCTVCEHDIAPRLRLRFRLMAITTIVDVVHSVHTQWILYILSVAPFIFFCSPIDT